MNDLVVKFVDRFATKFSESTHADLKSKDALVVLNTKVHQVLQKTFANWNSSFFQGNFQSLYNRLPSSDYLLGNKTIFLYINDFLKSFASFIALCFFHKLIPNIFFFRVVSHLLDIGSCFIGLRAVLIGYIVFAKTKRFFNIKKCFPEDKCVSLVFGEGCKKLLDSKRELQKNIEKDYERKHERLQEFLDAFAKQADESERRLFEINAIWKKIDQKYINEQKVFQEKCQELILNLQKECTFLDDFPHRLSKKSDEIDEQLRQIDEILPKLHHELCGETFDRDKFLEKVDEFACLTQAHRDQMKCELKNIAITELEKFYEECEEKWRNEQEILKTCKEKITAMQKRFQKIRSQFQDYMSVYKKIEKIYGEKLEQLNKFNQIKDLSMQGLQYSSVLYLPEDCVAKLSNEEVIDLTNLSCKDILEEFVDFNLEYLFGQKEPQKLFGSFENKPELISMIYSHMDLRKTIYRQINYIMGRKNHLKNLIEKNLNVIALLDKVYGDVSDEFTRMIAIPRSSSQLRHFAQYISSKLDSLDCLQFDNALRYLRKKWKAEVIYMHLEGRENMAEGVVFERFSAIYWDIYKDLRKRIQRANNELATNHIGIYQYAQKEIKNVLEQMPFENLQMFLKLKAILFFSSDLAKKHEVFFKKIDDAQIKTQKHLVVLKSVINLGEWSIQKLQSWFSQVSQEVSNSALNEDLFLKSENILNEIQGRFKIRNKNCLNNISEQTHKNSDALNICIANFEMQNALLLKKTKSLTQRMQLIDFLVDYITFYSRGMSAQTVLQEEMVNIEHLNWAKKSFLINKLSEFLKRYSGVKSEAKKIRQCIGKYVHLFTEDTLTQDEMKVENTWLSVVGLFV